ncbi:hypothetical protein GSY74_06140 [Sulfurovum sp. bin170]|uniref:hypothetical protein n=1 Tax=Sulfurovum sp. bin170 TaxID=2695268 RepID=UPI0013DF8F41|nr:hypothetical protein [Sulfurovum sp. bin170]NEW60858.1 hypothetical protein [Sulfurovum sp. bin170]
MQKNIIYSSLAILLLNACGGGSSTTTTTTEEKIESVETVKTTIEKAGFTLTSLAPSTSSKIQKTDPTTVTVAYTATQKVDITAEVLYLIVDSEQNEIFATIDATTIDATTLFDQQFSCGKLSNNMSYI